VSAVPERRTIFVTGGAGALGQRLLAELRQAGWTTRCLIHRRPVAGADEVEHGDLEDAESLRGAMAGVDAVIHLAGVTHARNAREYHVNVTGTRALLAAAPAGLGRFVYVSSRTAAPGGGSYSESKLAAEEAVRASGLPWIIIRLPEIYGTGLGEGADDIVERARRGAPIFVVGRGSQELRPIFIDDALLGLVSAVSSRADRETYTLAGERMTMREFAVRSTRALGSGSRIVPVPRVAVAAGAALARFAPLPLYPDQLSRLDVPKPDSPGDALTDLGFRPRRLEAVLSALAQP
jgi:UDP-glucose 4-epimerase